MYGIGAVKYKGAPVGYIAKNSFDMGGVKPEAAEIEAEQVPGAPVLVIPQSNGKISPKFDMIQLNFDSLRQLLGGDLHKSGDKTVGWTAPAAAPRSGRPWKSPSCPGSQSSFPTPRCSPTLLKQADADRDREDRGRAETVHAYHRRNTPLRRVRDIEPPRRMD